MSMKELFLFLVLHFCGVKAYGSGPPSTTCFTQYPKHYAAKQTDPSPFVLTFGSASYQPGKDITITIHDETGADFAGVQMAARRLAGNAEEIVGRFVDYPTDKTESINCYGGFQNMIGHRNNDPVTNLTVTWRPPSENVGDVSFRATFVRSYEVFWVATETTLPVDSTAPVSSPAYPAIPLQSQTNSINFDDCGDTKGCFYYPRSCSGSDCTAVATYEYRASSKDFLVELYSNNDKPAQWISLGLSDDEWMGNDLTITCTGGVGLLSIQEGYNPGQYNTRLLNLYTSEHEVKESDGKLQCRFVVPETMYVYTMNQDVKDSFKYNNVGWSLKEKHFIFIAWGDNMPGSNTITYHADKPIISSSKIDLTKKVIIFSSTFHTMVQVHATLMIVAWVLFAGIVTVISRHYRDWMEHSRPCGSALWFQIHRTLAVLVAALTIAGIIVIFTHYGTGIRDTSTPHAYVGLAAVGCVGLQIIAGILRPGLEHALRPVFNFGHRFTGHASHILAAATMYLAYDLDYISSDMRSFGFVSLSVWLGVQVFWHVMYEIIKRYRSKSARSNTYNIDGNELKPDANGDEKINNQDCPHTTTLITYILTLCGVCAVAIYPIYYY